MDCPKCGKAMCLEDKDTSSGRDMRTYYCDRCRESHIVDNGIALWKALSDAREDEPAEAKRSLGESQVKAIEHALAECPVGCIRIIPVWSTPEVLSFASQLEEIVDRTTKNLPDGGLTMLPPLDRAGFPSGVVIQYAPGSDAGHKFSTVLAHFLKANGIAANAVPGTSNWDGPGVVIMIGEIPQEHPSS